MNADELRKIAKQDNLIIGTDRTLKSLKEDKVTQVFVTKNCPSYVKKEIASLLSGAELIEIEQTNQQLGIICKKPFPISVISLLRA